MKTEKQELAQKSLRALYLELPESIAANHHKIIDEAFQEIRHNQFADTKYSEKDMISFALWLKRKNDYSAFGKYSYPINGKPDVETNKDLIDLWEEESKTKDT